LWFVASSLPSYRCRLDGDGIPFSL